MKSKQILLVGLLSLVLFTGAAKEDVAKNLSTFERSLMEWMRSTEATANKIAALEKRLDEQKGVSPELVDSLRDIAENVKALRNNLSSLSGRLTRMEDTLGGAAEDNPMVEFGRTLNILKKNAAELKKRVDDQAAVAAVLANKYADFMRPLDPIKKALGEQKGAIDTLQKDVSAQKEKLGALESLLVDRLTILEDFLATAEKQERDVSLLLKRVGNIETNTGIIPPEELFTEEEIAAVEEQAAEEEARPKTPEEEGYEAIGDGLYVRDVIFQRFGSSAKMTGEIKNLSDRDFRLAIFNIMVYNLDNVLVSDRDFTVKGLKIGTVKKFKETLTGTDPEDISKYVITLKSASQS